MRRSLTTIVGFGIVTAIFMAMMSMFYLQHIPTKEDLKRLETDLRREHGLYLSAAAPLDLKLVRPQAEGEKTGLEAVCTLRPDIQRNPEAVQAYLERVGDSILDHPDLRGRLGWATVSHSAPLAFTTTRWPKARVLKTDPVPVPPAAPAPPKTPASPPEKQAAPASAK